MNNINQPPIVFAQTDEEALERFNKYKSKDPFLEIAPALLNSADIYDYVAVTGMIYPFNAQDLKSASYAVPILGKVVYWDEHDHKKVELIEEGQEFVLRKNSIAFVTVEPMLRIPDYIAFRFNLKITNVYRGILLGTGPLVDPGFIGKLSIPLHNLTTNDYTFTGGDTLIWIEFTKLSPNKLWDPYNQALNSALRQGDYIKFTPIVNADVETYLRKADQHRSIRSSMSGVQASALELEKNVNKTLDKLNLYRNLFSVGTIIGVIALVIPFAALILQIISLVREKDDLVHKTNIQIEFLQKEVKAIQEKINNLQKKK